MSNISAPAAAFIMQGKDLSCTEPPIFTKYVQAKLVLKFPFFCENQLKLANKLVTIPLPPMMGRVDDRHVWLHKHCSLRNSLKKTINHFLGHMLKLCTIGGLRCAKSYTLCTVLFTWIELITQIAES